MVVTGVEAQRDAIDDVAHPGYELIGELEAIFGQMVAFVAARVSAPGQPHTPETYQPTGELLASGSSSTDYDGSEWSGEISYNAGHAVYEWEREGVHDAFLGLEVFEQQLGEAIGSHFEGD